MARSIDRSDQERRCILDRPVPECDLRQTTDFPALTQSYYQAFGALPAADEADPLARNMIDIDGGLALSTLKTLKAADRAGDLILESGIRLKMRPGSLLQAPRHS